MNVSIEIEGKRYNVSVEVAHHIADLRQQNTMLRKAIEREAQAPRTGSTKPKDK